MKRFFLCAGLAVALLIGITGCETAVRSEGQRAAHQRRIAENDMKLLVEDWDTFWLLDRPSHLSKWVER
jgi:hypothetical protein